MTFIFVQWGDFEVRRVFPHVLLLSVVNINYIAAIFLAFMASQLFFRLISAETNRQSNLTNGTTAKSSIQFETKEFLISFA